METWIGVDARHILNEFDIYGIKKRFRTMMGVVLVSKANLQERYEKALKDSLGELGIETERKVLSSHEILSLTEGDTKPLESMFESLFPDIYKVNIIYSSFNSKRIPEIKVFGKIGVQLKTVDELYDEHLMNSFPHICIWKVSEYARNTKAHVLCDHFFSYTTDAWEQITDLDLSILYNGDKCHHLISLADIFLRVIELRLRRAKKAFYPASIGQVLGCDGYCGPKLHVHIVNNKTYPKITPLDRKGQPFIRFIKRPVYYILKPKGGTISIDTIIAKSPGLMNEVTEREGCIVAFHERTHSSMLKEGDVVVYLDRQGEIDADTLSSLAGVKKMKL